MLVCGSYELGSLKRLYQPRHWSYIFSADYPIQERIYLVAVAVIALTGIFGENCQN